MAARSVTLHDGSEHPMLGFGTYKVGFVPASASSAVQPKDDRDPKEIIKDAVAVGYRYFDCAQFYGNEAMVGQALKDSGVDRKELYLVSKVWCDTIYKGPEAVKAQVHKCLADLQTDYLDLYLVHWPVPGKHVQAYKALEELHKEGKIKGIGVSNYTIEDYNELKAEMTIKPLVNQIEVNPFLYRRRTIQFFQDEGIQIEAYRALRNGKEMDNERIKSIAEKHKCTPAQVLTAWCLQHNIIVIAKSSKKVLVGAIRVYSQSYTMQNEQTH
ncbi:hypothetical protein PTSG_12899 [Salpingoeca rosetta]|uniref:NADP-dependent oxidoreductase domain-containing protein n=1 Tax=Salpingoeca rosetta (strain ATCC 50818 / BSB-021) TaxID=946362 RepID=F2ULC3_SALR5|nr:uncharacterized protein PTSG_12899 [Salpingoeca rosetta]EGD77922.1 hypothetical protein PTSG_12899 [Salpingoeca rosetta]|eukprot:XP_004989986.1 hypothetical protein PTSG_12899 [Salpingoeca rosetta]